MMHKAAAQVWIKAIESLTADDLEMEALDELATTDEKAEQCELELQKVKSAVLNFLKSQSS